MAYVFKEQDGEKIKAELIAVINGNKQSTTGQPIDSQRRQALTDLTSGETLHLDRLLDHVSNGNWPLEIRILSDLDLFLTEMRTGNLFNWISNVTKNSMELLFDENNAPRDWLKKTLETFLGEEKGQDAIKKLEESPKDRHKFAAGLLESIIGMASNNPNVVEKFDPIAGQSGTDQDRERYIEESESLDELIKNPSKHYNEILRLLTKGIARQDFLILNKLSRLLANMSFDPAGIAQLNTLEQQETEKLLMSKPNKKGSREHKKHLKKLQKAYLLEKKQNRLLGIYDKETHPKKKKKLEKQIAKLESKIKKYSRGINRIAVLQRERQFRFDLPKPEPRHQSTTSPHTESDNPITPRDYQDVLNFLDPNATNYSDQASKARLQKIVAITPLDTLQKQYETARKGDSTLEAKKFRQIVTEMRNTGGAKEKIKIDDFDHWADEYETELAKKTKAKAQTKHQGQLAKLTEEGISRTTAPASTLTQHQQSLSLTDPQREDTKDSEKKHERPENPNPPVEGSGTFKIKQP